MAVELPSDIIVTGKSSTSSLRREKSESVRDYVRSKKWADNEWTPFRRWVDHQMSLKRFDWCLGALIMLNIVLIVVQTDAMASNSEPPQWISISDRMISLVYFLELCARIYVHRAEFFGSFREIVDSLIVLSDIVTFCLDTFDSNGAILSLGFLKIFRMMRLARVVKLMTMIPELQQMVRSLAFASKPIAWGMLLVVVCLFMWSILGVQFIHPLVQEAASRGAFDSCDRCERAFSSVAQGMLTLTQTLIAGDSWGLVAIPIVEAHPETFVFFLLAIMSNSIGVLNIILALIVESAMEARKYPDHERAKEKEVAKAEATKHLKQLCELLDKDKTGTLTIDELKDGMHENAEFSDCMIAMDITPEDMTTVFHILDEDRSGEVDYEEFVKKMHDMRSSDMHTLLIFIKHYTKTIHDSLFDEIKVLEKADDNLLDDFKLLEEAVQSFKKGEHVDNEKPPGACSTSVRKPKDDGEYRGMAVPPWPTESIIRCSESVAQLDGEDAGRESIEADLAQLKARVNASLQAACADMLQRFDSFTL